MWPFRKKESEKQPGMYSAFEAVARMSDDEINEYLHLMAQD